MRPLMASAAHRAADNGGLVLGADDAVGTPRSSSLTLSSRVQLLGDHLTAAGHGWRDVLPAWPCGGRRRARRPSIAEEHVDHSTQ
jgi:hypothetical protein